LDSSQHSGATVDEVELSFAVESNTSNSFFHSFRHGYECFQIDTQNSVKFVECGETVLIFKIKRLEQALGFCGLLISNLRKSPKSLLCSEVLLKLITCIVPMYILQ
jgi:hypothetical protein